MNNSESLSAHDLDRVARAAAGQSNSNATFENPMGAPALIHAVDEHNGQIASLVETAERLIDRLAPVVDYPKPQPVASTGAGLPPPASPTPKLYERVQSHTERLARLERQLTDIISRLTV